MPNPFTARWSATGSALCLGHWEISYLDHALTLDAERMIEDMGTHGIYSYIFPDDEDYAEGLPENEWIIENANWLISLFASSDIPCDETHLRWFYQAISQSDWRCGSCGGCT